MDQNALFSDSVIMKIYRGDISPDGVKIYDSPQMMFMQKAIDEMSLKLTASLTKEQQQLFDQIVDYSGDMRTLREAELFSYAFKLGARIMLEVKSKADE